RGALEGETEERKIHLPTCCTPDMRVRGNGSGPSVMQFDPNFRDDRSPRYSKERNWRGLDVHGYG
ncbi:MAG: hypothetical protein ACK4UN_20740, partial [Limisphaerales bacterium]